MKGAVLFMILVVSAVNGIDMIAFIVISLSLRRLSSTRTFRVESGRRVQSVGEVGLAGAVRLRVVVRTMAGRLTRAGWAGDVVVGEGDVGAVLPVERYLEEVGQVAVGSATQTARRNGPSVDDVVASGVLRERRRRVMTVHRLCHVNVPLCPATGCAIHAGLLHDSFVI